MRPHLRTAVGLALVCALGGCSAAADVTGSASEAVDAVADQAVDAASNISAGSAEVCTAERRVLETAIEAYTTLEGTAPHSEADLVAGQYLVDESKLFDLDAAGTIVPATGSACT